MDRKRFREKIRSRERPSHKGALDCQPPLKLRLDTRFLHHDEVSREQSATLYSPDRMNYIPSSRRATKRVDPLLLVCALRPRPSTKRPTTRLRTRRVCPMTGISYWESNTQIRRPQTRPSKKAPSLPHQSRTKHRYK